jgi:hypothetical protein
MSVESTDHSRYEWVSSLYGPGPTSAWYLTFLAVVVSWTLHPQKRVSDSIESELLGSSRGGRRGKESSEARRVAVMVAFSMPAGEGSEADHSEGRSTRQKEKERRGVGRAQD